MGKTLKHKKRRKNTRRYKQKRRKTTRKSKRKYQRTRKQKGGLCCKYENDWEWSQKRKGINWNPTGKGDGCNKGFKWDTDTKANAPPFLIPFWQRWHVNDPDSKYYGNKFGLLKYTPVQLARNKFGEGVASFTTMGKIKIGLFYHSLKHMEALGIKCYEIKKFTNLIKRITEVGQWFYMRAQEVKEENPDVMMLQQKEKALTELLEKKAKKIVENAEGEGDEATRIATEVAKIRNQIAEYKILLEKKEKLENKLKLKQNIKLNLEKKEKNRKVIETQEKKLKTYAKKLIRMIKEINKLKKNLLNKQEKKSTSGETKSENDTKTEDERKQEIEKWENAKMQKMKNPTKTEENKDYWAGKTLIPIVYSREKELGPENRCLTKPGGTVLVDFNKFFENITYKSNKSYSNPSNEKKVTQISAGIRTCKCVYVFANPIKYNKNDSKKIAHEGERYRVHGSSIRSLVHGGPQEEKGGEEKGGEEKGEWKKDEEVQTKINDKWYTGTIEQVNPPNPEDLMTDNSPTYNIKFSKREVEAYDVAAVNLIFGKFVKRRMNNRKMVKNDISENNKNALFLLAIEVYDTANFTKYCNSHTSGMQADEGKDLQTYHTLDLNNTSDCIGNSGKDWYLTRNKAPTGKYLGTADALTPIKKYQAPPESKGWDSNDTVIKESIVLKEQYKLYEKFLLGDKKEKIKTLLERSEKIYPEGITGLKQQGDVELEQLRKELHQITNELKNLKNEKIKVEKISKTNKLKFNEELPFFQALKKIYADKDKVERMKNLDPTYTNLLMGQIGAKFVENAKTFNFELTKFINQLTNEKKKALKQAKDYRFATGKSAVKSQKDFKKISKGLKEGRKRQGETKEQPRRKEYSDYEKIESALAETQKKLEKARKEKLAETQAAIAIQDKWREISPRLQPTTEEKETKTKTTEKKQKFDGKNTKFDKMLPKRVIPSPLRSSSASPEAKRAREKIPTRPMVRNVLGIPVADIEPAETKSFQPVRLYEKQPDKEPPKRHTPPPFMRTSSDPAAPETVQKRSAVLKAENVAIDEKKKGLRTPTLDILVPHLAVPRMDDPKLSKDFKSTFTPKLTSEEEKKNKAIAEKSRVFESQWIDHFNRRVPAELMQKKFPKIKKKTHTIHWGKKKEENTQLEHNDDRAINPGHNKFMLVESMLQQLRNQYINFYVERTACETNAISETINSDLKKTIMDNAPFADFVTVNDKCEVTLKPPPSVKETTAIEDVELTMGGNKKTRKRKRRKRKRKRTRKR